MAAAYRRLIKMRPIITWVGSIVIVAVASAAFSAIETWSLATFVQPGIAARGAALPRRDPAHRLAARRLVGALLQHQLLSSCSRSRRDRLLRLENQASNAQLAMLRYQLNPHFLFNTLNSISTLVLLKQTDRANAMLSRLSSFLRYTLVNEPTGHGDGRAGGRDAEALSRDREDALRGAAARRISTSTRSVTRARLPSLLLQPLVENAIKYAVTPQEEGADIVDRGRGATSTGC